MPPNETVYTIQLDEGDMASVLALLETEAKFAVYPGFWNEIMLKIRQQINGQLMRGTPCSTCKRRKNAVLQRLSL